MLCISVLRSAPECRVFASMIFFFIFLYISLSISRARTTYNVQRNIISISYFTVYFNAFFLGSVSFASTSITNYCQNANNKCNKLKLALYPLRTVADKKHHLIAPRWVRVCVCVWVYHPSVASGVIPSCCLATLGPHQITQLTSKSFRKFKNQRKNSAREMKNGRQHSGSLACQCSVCVCVCVNSSIPSGFSLSSCHQQPSSSSFCLLRRMFTRGARARARYRSAGCSRLRPDARACVCVSLCVAAHYMFSLEITAIACNEIRSVIQWCAMRICT